MADLQHALFHEERSINPSISKKRLEDFQSVLTESLPARIFSLSVTHYLTFRELLQLHLLFLLLLWVFWFLCLLFINRLSREAVKYGVSLFARKMEELISHVAFLAGNCKLKYITQLLLLFFVIIIVIIKTELTLITLQNLQFIVLPLFVWEGTKDTRNKSTVLKKSVTSENLWYYSSTPSFS